MYWETFHFAVGMNSPGGIVRVIKNNDNQIKKYLGI
jgi:hypothetical protein